MADIEKYLNGELTSSEMHALEKASLEDPFLGDALEGIRKDRLQRGPSFFHRDLADLKKNIEDRVAENKIAENKIAEKNAIPLPLRIRFRTWQVAAAIGLLTGLGALSYFSIVGDKSARRPLAKSAASRSDVAAPSTETIHRETIRSDDSTATANAGLVARKDSLVPGKNITTTDQYQAAETGSQTLVRAKSADHSGVRPPTGNAIDFEDKQNQEARAIARAYRQRIVRDNDKVLSKGKDPNKDKESNTDRDLNKDRDLVKKDLAGEVAGVTILTPDHSLMPPVSTDNPNVFNGKVVGADGRPVAFASISLRDRPDATTTDSSGLFSLHLSGPDTLIDITVRSAGYAALKTVLRNNPSFHVNNKYHDFNNGHENNLNNLEGYSNQILLQRENNMALREIAVSDYGRLKSKKKALLPGNAEAAAELTGSKEDTLIQKAEPAGGWAAYYHYLETNKKIATSDSIFTGKEVISFLVNRNGKVSSFQIGQSLSAAHDAEAIRLIKQGPAWKLLKGKKERTTLIIPF